MTHGFPKAFFLVAGMATIGCAHTPPPAYYVYRTPDPRAEELAIEAAKHHPIAQPRIRTEYPEQAPPPLPQGASLPPPAYITRRAEPLQLSEPDYYDSGSYSGYSDYAPSYSYPYSYGYYGPAYPAYRYRLGYGVGWRSSYGYGWGPHYHASHYDAWPHARYRDVERPQFHGMGMGMDHHHGDFRPGPSAPHLSEPSHGSFHSGGGGGHSTRQPRVDVRVHR